MTINDFGFEQKPWSIVMEQLGGVSLPLLVAIVVLSAGLIGSVVPGLPSGLLSLLGLLGYWTWSGFTQPPILALAVLSTLAFLAFLTDTFAGPAAAKKGGATNTTIIASVGTALALSVLLGPLGFLVGLPLAILLITYWKTDDVNDSLHAATYTTIGILGSFVAQSLLTGMVLAGFIYVTVL